MEAMTLDAALNDQVTERACDLSSSRSLLPLPSQSRRPLSLVKRCVFAMLPLLALLTVVEITARLLARDDTATQRFAQIEQIIVYLGNEPGQSIFEPDPDCFWRLKPNVVLPTDRGPSWGGRMSNSHGLRSREVSIDAARQRLRVLCFGDSSTFAFGVPFADAWPNQLQRLLDVEAPGAVEVLNAGIPGQTTYQGRQRLQRELHKWSPQLAVITFGNNDGWRWDGMSDADHARRFDSVRSLSFLNHSQAWRWLSSRSQQSAQTRATQSQLDWARQATWNYFDPNARWTPRVAVDDFATNLHAMIDACRQQDCRPVLVVWPDRRQLQGEPTWRPPYQAAMRQVAHDAGVPCLDLVPLFEQGGQWAVDRFLPNDVVHLDRAGNEIVSDAVARYVRDVRAESGSIESGSIESEPSHSSHSDR